MISSALICGAGRGIGFEVVNAFLEKGIAVCALSRNIEALLALNHPNLTAIEIDLSEKQSFLTLKPWVENVEKVDYILYNAGYLEKCDFEDSTLSLWDITYRTNVFGAVQVLQFCKPYITSSSEIGLVSSMGGIQGSSKFPGLSAYSSSKAALITLGECLAEEWKGIGASINTFALGAVDTDMLQEAFPGYSAPVSAKKMGVYLTQWLYSNQGMVHGKTMQIAQSTP